ncbi:MAG: aminopeptidase P family N-terminal domain-containing protein, partial [Candidatus Heimdallarchaeota archaeon]|nr:aminopeptidase P family N-terminal domain-containing protein [Candidatus Heimdallarchaeota archaeon]
MTFPSIPQEQYQKRRNQFCSKIEDLDLNHFIVLSPKSIYYLTGFSMIPTERPFILVFKNEDINFFVPELEKLHVQEEVPSATVIQSYFEYPDLIHPLKHFSNFIKKTLGIKEKIGAEGGGAPGIWGYQGPR